jgi:hypothetical protein
MRAPGPGKGIMTSPIRTSSPPMKKMFLDSMNRGSHGTHPAGVETSAIAAVVHVPYAKMSMSKRCGQGLGSGSCDPACRPDGCPAHV